MDDQRLERALRSGPPFRTQYSTRTLKLEGASVVPHRALRRTLVILAVAGIAILAVAAGLFVGSLRPRASALTCADAARSVGAATARWVDGRPAVSAAEARAGMLVVHDRAGGISLLDPDTGFACASLDLGEGRDLYGPIAWSPDGGALALVVAGEGDEGPYDLVVLSRAGVVRSALRSDRPFDFAWSPDGSKVAAFSSFASHDGSRTRVGVWLVPADGSGPRQMTIDCRACTADEGLVRGWADTIAWSPEGDRLALAFEPATGSQPFLPAPRRWRLWVGPSAGDRLTEVAEVSVLSLEGWLDGSTLVALDPDERRVVISMDSGEVEAAPPDAPDPELSAGGTLSPDGRLRAVVDGDGVVRITDLATASSRTLARDPRFAFSPVIWAPDSTRIALGSSIPDARPDAVAVWIVDISDGDVTDLTDADVYPVAWQPIRSTP